MPRVARASGQRVAAVTRLMIHKSRMTQTRAELVTDFVQDVLAREGAAWVSAASSSMAPLIQSGDELCLAPPQAGRVRAGAVIAFRRGGELVVHRVVRRGPAGVVTRGDALPAADAPVPWSDVVARVAAIRTPRGRLLDLDRRPWPLIGRGLAAVARLGAPNRLAWIARRAPFHLAALVSR